MFPFILSVSEVNKQNSHFVTHCFGALDILKANASHVQKVSRQTAHAQCVLVIQVCSTVDFSAFLTNAVIYCLSTECGVGVGVSGISPVLKLDFMSSASQFRCILGTKKIPAVELTVTSFT